ADRAHRALGDRQLRVALDRATAQLASRRGGAFASLPDREAVRESGRADKLEVRRDLAGHLERFERALRANGVQVHWAETGADANRIVCAIARSGGATRAGRWKWGGPEETGLNEALLADGVQVVETDLGEYVVQLAHDRPSHIILPIIHRTREEVGRVMHEHMGVPLSDDTRTLAGYARERLRAEFLRADLGITGANFGVVEDGTLCLVTNEGNGRMVTTLPRVHVALMGIEKLVPTMADLARLLQVLARSATGQKITTYTTLLRGPRREGDA